MLYKEGCRKKSVLIHLCLISTVKSYVQIYSFWDLQITIFSAVKSDLYKSIHYSHMYVFNKWILYTSYLKEDLI